MDSADYHSIDNNNSEEKGCFKLMPKPRFIIAIILVVLGIILSFCGLAPVPKVGFFFLFFIGSAFGVLAAFVLVSFNKQYQNVVGSKILIIVVIVFLVFFVLNLIIGLATNVTWLVAIFLIVQWLANLFYIFKNLPNGLGSVREAFA